MGDFSNQPQSPAIKQQVPQTSGETQNPNINKNTNAYEHIHTAAMCIVLATTAHPSYALIVLDNRDEFILRPTSRPHWWTSNHQEILSARDLQRAEQGTWLGITKTGNFAVLTNYRETDANDAAHPIQGTRSRGGMVTAWLTAAVDESTPEFVQRMMAGDGVKGVGGFSLLCGKLRKRNEHELEPLAIISNRCESVGHVPWIAGQRGEVYELSKSIFIPSIGSVAPIEQPPNPNAMTGIYGTQRQTIILVDWEGKVTFRERSLWDVMGNPIERGKGDMKFEFNIEGWNGEKSGETVYPHAVL